MIFTETKLKGAFIIDFDRKTDERGFFARAFCQNEFRDHGLKPVIAQANVASNAKKGTLRGMHFNPPAAESKLVRCTRGAPRHHYRSAAREPDLPRAHLRRAQRGQYDEFAHGYQALRDNTDTSYQVGEFYTTNAESGLRHDDPRLGLKWPLPVSVMSPKDQAFRPLREIEDEVKRRADKEFVARFSPAAGRTESDVWRATKRPQHPGEPTRYSCQATDALDFARPRSIYSWWREIWLERLSEEPQLDSKEAVLAAEPGKHHTTINRLYEMLELNRARRSLASLAQEQERS